MINYIKDFFLLNLDDYSNIGISFPIGIFLVALTVALSITAFIINNYKTKTAELLKQLFRHEATNEKNAKKLSSLRIKNSMTIRHALSGDGQLKELVRRVGEQKLTYEEYVALTKKRGYKEEKIDFDKALFYLDEENISRAKRIYETDNSSIVRPILLSVMLLAILVCCTLLVPELLSYLNDSLAN